MLYNFLTLNRQELIYRCRKKVEKRLVPIKASTSISHGAPLLIQQIANILYRDKATHGHEVHSLESAKVPVQTEIGLAAALHGIELLRAGYTVDQVVHDYGDVCQSVTELAVEQKVLISPEEFRTLNLCLDIAIADAVTSYGKRHEDNISVEAKASKSNRHGFSDDSRRLVEIAIQSFSAIKSGTIGVTGATAALHMNTLNQLRSLMQRDESPQDHDDVERA